MSLDPAVKIYKIQPKVAWLRFCAKAVSNEDEAYELSRQQFGVTASEFSFIWAEVRS